MGATAKAGRQAHAQSGRSATKHSARDRLHTAFVRVFGCGHGVMDELDALEALAGRGSLLGYDGNRRVCCLSISSVDCGCVRNIISN